MRGRTHLQVYKLGRSGVSCSVCVDTSATSCMGFLFAVRRAETTKRRDAIWAKTPRRTLTSRLSLPFPGRSSCCSAVTRLSRLPLVPFCAVDYVVIRQHFSPLMLLNPSCILLQRVNKSTVCCFSRDCDEAGLRPRQTRRNRLRA